MELDKVLNKLLDIESRRSSRHITRETLNLRVIMRVVALLDTEMSTVYATMYQQKVDPTVSEAIDKMWRLQDFVPTCVTASAKSDYESTIKGILSRDYFNPNELSKFCVTLQKSKCTDKGQTKLWALFAVDGLKGTEYKNYMNNLSISVEFGENSSDTVSHTTKRNILDEEEEEGPGVTHVKAIRSIYNSLPHVTPQDLNRVLRNLYELKEESDSDLTVHNSNSDSEDDEESKRTYDSESESDNDIDKHNKVSLDIIEKYYRQLVGQKIVAIGPYLKDEQDKMIKLKDRQRKRRLAVMKASEAKKKKSVE